MTTPTLEDVTRNDTAKAFHARLAAIDLAKVPVLSRDRSIPRKDQAKLARTLFREMGLKGVGVTVPKHAGADAVELRLPRRNDYTPDMLEAGGAAKAGNPITAANGKAIELMKTLLNQAFPQHADRSVYPADDFDYRWAITG